MRIVTWLNNRHSSGDKGDYQHAGHPTQCHSFWSTKWNRKRNLYLLWISSRDILSLYLLIFLLMYHVGGALGKESCLLKSPFIKSSCSSVKFVSDTKSFCCYFVENTSLNILLLKTIAAPEIKQNVLCLPILSILHIVCGWKWLRMRYM